MRFRIDCTTNNSLHQFLSPHQPLKKGRNSQRRRIVTCNWHRPSCLLMECWHKHSTRDTAFKRHFIVVISHNFFVSKIIRKCFVVFKLGKMFRQRNSYQLTVVPIIFLCILFFDNWLSLFQILNVIYYSWYPIFITKKVGIYYR